jgi:predicted 3-demethylubiquinone-9 3-methyltransferase (glyoxalase superfamily)
MNNSIYPCLWFNQQAKEAATFYCSVFNNAKIIADTPMVVKFEIEGKVIMGLNGGPMFKINPAISLFVTCQSNEEIENTWNKLIEGGTAMMPLDKYPWSEKYGWVVDQFGMTWQLMLGELPEGAQKITANFLFVGNQYGKAQEAIIHYTAVFPNSQIFNLQIYQAGEAQPEGKLKFGHFSLNHEQFAAMDGFGNHEFQFNEGVSLVVECETQQEIDHYWNKLTEGGTEVQCGWLKDKFGVSWQIVPTILSSLMSNPAKAEKTMQAFLKMKKFDIEELIKASGE